MQPCATVAAVHFCSWLQFSFICGKNLGLKNARPRRRKNLRSWEEWRDWAMDTQGACIHVDTLFKWMQIYKCTNTQQTNQFKAWICKSPWEYFELFAMHIQCWLLSVQVNIVWRFPLWAPLLLLLLKVSWNLPTLWHLQQGFLNLWIAHTIEFWTFGQEAK